MDNFGCEIMKIIRSKVISYPKFESLPKNQGPYGRDHTSQGTTSGRQEKQSPIGENHRPDRPPLLSRGLLLDPTADRAQAEERAKAPPEFLDFLEQDADLILRQLGDGNDSFHQFIQDQAAASWLCQL